MITSPYRAGAALLALALLLAWGCGDSDAAPGTPTVLSVTPTHGSIGVPRNTSVTAKFSEAMDRASLGPITFVLISESSTTPIAGTVTYAKSNAAFWPSSHLSANGSFTATITTGARSASGTPLASSRAWSFSTGDTLSDGLPVALASAEGFVILAKSGIATVPSSAITGDIGVSPAAASSITGFSLTADATNVYATSPQVTGQVFASDYTSPTPSNLTTAIADMELAFTDAAGRAPDVTELGAGNIGGMVLPPGVYRWGTGLLIPTDVTLAGSSSEVWIFQIAGNLTMESGTQILLSGGASAANVYWQVSGFVDLGTTAHCEGTVLAHTAITLRTGASVRGRLFAQTAVNLDASTVLEP